MVKRAIENKITSAIIVVVSLGARSLAEETLSEGVSFRAAGREWRELSFLSRRLFSNGEMGVLDSRAVQPSRDLSVIKFAISPSS